MPLIEDRSRPSSMAVANVDLRVVVGQDAGRCDTNNRRHRARQRRT